MKLTTLLLFAGIGLVAYGLLHEKGISIPNLFALPSTPAPSSPAPAATPVVAKSHRPAAVAQLARKNNISEDEAAMRLAVALRTQQRFYLDAIVFQHLADGHVLAKGELGETPYQRADSLVYAVYALPNADITPDKAEVQPMVVPIGTYEYTGLDGTRQLVVELLCVKTDSFDKIPKWDRYGHAINRDPSVVDQPIEGLPTPPAGAGVYAEPAKPSSSSFGGTMLDRKH